MIASLTETDKILLEKIQKDFPLVSRPFDYFGSICGISEDEVISKTVTLVSKGIIREISAIFNSGRLGYKSTLIALETPDDSIETVARTINSHAGVSHNYLRNYKYNIWFTLTIKEDKDFGEELKKLFHGEKIVRYLILPAVKTYKIGVNFKLTGRNNKNAGETAPVTKKRMKLSESDRKLINKLQEDLSIIARPWEKMASELKISEQDLFDHIEYLKEREAIKRISAVLRHRKVGYSSNGMACFNILEADIESAGKTVARYPEVSHCYQRKTHPGWEYSLFAMVHTRKEEECRLIIDGMSKKIGCSDYLILFSLREYKKERVKYFME